ncbi:hypothetical protein BD410DRAFT_847007 [Rickenella mellea]|uniref:Uncharacterized protein n=1 Tax=Rickenella mellea TaxID=50990 RepID=A0A4Y7PDR9_9AGAM|nr:hypothetical protein BD410DRAFT_847007 [Rickenella mellea]
MPLDPTDRFYVPVVFGDTNMYRSDPNYRHYCLEVATLVGLLLMQREDVFLDDIKYVHIPGGVHDSRAPDGTMNGDHLTIQSLDAHSRTTWVVHVPCVQKIFNVDDAKYFKQ